MPERLCADCKRPFTPEDDSPICPSCEDAEEEPIPWKRDHALALETADYYIMRQRREADFYPSVVTLGRCYKHNRDQIKQLRAELKQARLERDEARTNLAEASRMWDGPETADWMEAVTKEAAHQVARWGKRHDDGKDPGEFFWTLGYLANKAFAAALRGDAEKAKHHTISSGALLLNWHARIDGHAEMFRPGIETPDLGAGESPGVLLDDVFADVPPEQLQKAMTDLLAPHNPDGLEECPGCGDLLPESAGTIDYGDDLSCGCDGFWFADGSDVNPHVEHDEDCKKCAESLVGRRFRRDAAGWRQEEDAKVYRVTGIGEHNQTGETVVVCTCESDDSLWVFSKEEFGDGRFTPVEEATQDLGEDTDLCEDDT